MQNQNFTVLEANTLTCPHVVWMVDDWVDGKILEVVKPNCVYVEYHEAGALCSETLHWKDERLSIPNITANEENWKAPAKKKVTKKVVTKKVVTKRRR